MREKILLLYGALIFDSRKAGAEEIDSGQKKTISGRKETISGRKETRNGRGNLEAVVKAVSSAGQRGLYENCGSY
jgi:hypothetical protein